MWPETSYIASLEGAPLSSPTSGSQRKLLCTVTTSANQVTATGMKRTSATTSGANVWPSSRGLSNQRKGWCVLVWTCLKTIPIKNDVWLLIRLDRFKQPFNQVLHLNVGECYTCWGSSIHLLLRGAEVNPSWFQVWAEVQSFIYNTVTNYICTLLFDECKEMFYISHQLSNAPEKKLPVKIWQFLPKIKKGEVR